VALAAAEGRLALLEAAARFAALNRSAPQFNWPQFRRAYPGASDEERFCREVIAWAEGEAGPAGAEAARARLAGELEGGLRRGLLLPLTAAKADL
jgi:hypothetical protein